MKNHRRLLFTHPHPYAIKETSGLFLEAIAAAGCPIMVGWRS